jgi:outer membrane immunogenic protein
MKRVLFGLALAAAMGVGTAVAADVVPDYRAPPEVVVPSTWTGFYAGANAGGTWTDTRALWEPVPTSALFGVLPIAGNTGGSSAIGGLQVGYNWQVVPAWVIGLESDWSWAHTGTSVTAPWIVNPGGGAVSRSFTIMSSTLDWVSSLRARLGYLVTPDFMLYGTAGGALGKIDYAASNSGGAIPYTTSTAFSRTQGGWVAGGGLEWMITPNWLLRGEYLYYSLDGSPSVVAGSVTPIPLGASGYSWSNTNASVARAALSYRF